VRTAFTLPSVVLSAVLVAAAPVPKEKERPATDENRKEVEANLKAIALALQTHSSQNRDVWPADTAGGLSWRVLLLPHLGEDKLFQEFNLNEAWDSATNKKLIEKLPKVYAPTRVTAEPGETFYRGFAGTGKMGGMLRTDKRVKLTNVTDGLSNTIAVIDAGEPVIWTKPGTDLDPDAKEFPKLGRMIDGDFYCAMTDGGVRKVKREFDGRAMRAAVSIAGNERENEADLFVK
jgi:hypothetical protein